MPDPVDRNDGPDRHSAAAAGHTHHNAGTRLLAGQRHDLHLRVVVRPLDALSGPLDDACQLWFSLAVL